MGDSHMTQEQKDALERRNRYESEHILNELKEIKTMAKSAEKSSQELVGDMKVVMGRLKGINGSIAKHECNFDDLTVLLRGDPKDQKDAGLVGEHITMRDYITQDLQPMIKKLRWWFISSMLTIVLAGSLAGYLYLQAK